MQIKGKILYELFKNFLGNSSPWYKILIISFLVLNPLIYFLDKTYLKSGFAVIGWIIVIESIIILMMTTQCFPFPPLTLLICEAVAIKLIDPHNVYHEIMNNLSVIMLVMFSTAAIYFHKDFLSYIFSKILMRIKSRTILSVSILTLSALLSAFLDALTVVVIMVSVANGLFSTYMKYIKNNEKNKDNSSNLKSLRKFLRDILMTSAIGTAIGGVSTIVGEPQNYIIAKIVEWDFITFAYRMRFVSISCFISSIIICIIVNKLKIFGYGFILNKEVKRVIKKREEEIEKNMKLFEKISFFSQGLSIILFITLIAYGFAEIGVISIAIIGIITSFTGITDEKKIGEAFTESLPFAILIILFFAVISMVESLELFKPIIHWAFTFSNKIQLLAFYIANSILSMVSDNVFVAGIYINEVNQAFKNNIINQEQFEKLAITINAGTNISSIATPNGQAAFLFLLTSSIAPLINLSYGRMIKMALPYTILLSIVAIIACCLI